MMNLVRALVAITLALTNTTFAQTGQIAPGQVLGNPSASQAPASPANVSALLDRAIGTSPGRVLCRNSTVWSGCAAPILGVPGVTAGSLAFAGSSSGTATFVPQAVAGTPTITIPTASGTIAVGAASPIVLSATTGALTCPTCVTSSGGGAITGVVPIAVSGAGAVSITGAALTKTDDSNVTLTLGGAPTSALVNATSLTIGWNGLLPVTRGGTGLGVAVQGDIFYYDSGNLLTRLAKSSNATRYLSNTGTSNNPAWAQVDLSNGVSGDLPFANIAQISSARLLGRQTAGSGDIEQLTGSQATSLLSEFVGDSGAGGTKGLVPAPSAGDAAAAKFLHANGTWTTPAGGGTVTSVGIAVGAGLSTSGTCTITTSGACTVALTAMGHLYGLTVSNNATDPTNDFDFAFGQAADDTNGYIMQSSAITKRTDASWAVGTNQGCWDTGSVANGTIHLFQIQRSDTGVVDKLCSASPTAPTMPASYDRKRRIASIPRVSGSIIAVRQYGDTFKIASPSNSISSTNAVTDALLTLTNIPTGITVQPLLQADAIAAATTNCALLIDDAAITTPNQALVRATLSGQSDHAQSQNFMTNTAAQIRHTILNTSNTSCTSLRLFPQGWNDGRDR